MSGPNTVLLAEDDPTDALLIRRALGKLHVAADLRVVADGEAAVAYLAGEGPYADREQHPFPVLVLLDIKLPRRSGLEVLAWLRTRPGLRRLPAVMLTASQESSDVNRAFDLGANSYLVKPVEFEALQEMLRSAGLYWLVHNQRPETHEPPPA